MRRTIRTVLGENARNLGTLRFDVQGARESAAFEFDAAWLAAADRFALDPGLPLVTGPQFHRKERGGSVFQQDERRGTVDRMAFYLDRIRQGHAGFVEPRSGRFLGATRAPERPNEVDTRSVSADERSRG